MPTVINPPYNPFPPSGSPADISQLAFDSALKEFIDDGDSEKFLSTNLDTQRRPNNGELDYTANSILDTKKILMDTIDRDVWYGHWYFSRIVYQTSYIKTAVCLGLGTLAEGPEEQSTEHFIYQCAFFLAFCEVIEQKQHMAPGSLPRIFQDPRFALEDEYVLTCVGGQITSNLAHEYIDHGTFLYAPNLDFDVLLDYLFRPGRHPEMYVGNQINNYLFGRSLAERHIKTVYRTGVHAPSSEIQQLREQMKRFCEQHLEYPFPRGDDGVIMSDTALANHYVYIGIHHDYTPHQHVNPAQLAIQGPP